MSNDMELPPIDIVAGLPSGYEKIWKILWSVDPARFKRFTPDIRQNLAKITIDHQIFVSRTVADLYQREAEALEQLSKTIGFR